MEGGGEAVGGGLQYGPVAVSALGSGRACPTAVIALCPFGRSSAPTQCESCSDEQVSCLWPLHLRAPGGGGGFLWWEWGLVCCPSW